MGKLFYLIRLPDMRLKSWVTGPLMVNTYLVFSEGTKAGALIDPGSDEERILNYIKDNNINLLYIINTHGHPDHILGNGYFKKNTQAKIVIHEADAELLTNPDPLIVHMLQGKLSLHAPDKELKEGEEIKIGDFNLEVIHTPGHTPGGISLKTEGIIFTGDTLFAGGIGRTDFPGGSYPAIIDSIKNKLLTLDHSYEIYPGHGPASTIQTEFEYNPFLT